MKRKNVPVSAAAAIMNKSVQFVRCGLKAGKFPFDAAVQCSSRTSYYISPQKFMEFTGCSEQELDYAIDGSD